MGSPSGTDRRVVGRRYRLIEPLGKGGMGTVWRAHDQLLDRTVAVKEVDLPQLGEIDRVQLRERTMREARAAARLTHPNAVTVYDVVEDGGQPWIVMQLVAAESLADMIRDGGPLQRGRVAEIGLAVLSALEAAHAAGILHRDVKPGNVLIGHDGRTVLTDFGIATLEGDPSLTSTGLLLGAPAYIAPERARGLTPGPASDLWSLGATLHTALKGRPPYDRGTPLATLTATINEDPPPLGIDGPLGAAIGGLLQRDPQQRISAPQVRRLLEQARDAAVDRASELSLSATLGRTLETPAPAAGADSDEDTDGSAVAAADHTQVVYRPDSDLADSPIPPAPLPPTQPADSPGVLGPSQRGEAPAGPASRARPRAVVLAALAVVLVGAIVAVALLANRDRDTSAGERASGSGATPSAGTSPQPSSPPPASSPASANSATPASPGAGPAGPGTAPPGYTLHRDRAGFSVAVPDGWQRTKEAGNRKDGQFDFVDPTNESRFLRFGYTTSPKSDPVADWEQQEKRLRAREPSYQRISIKAVDYRDYATADWDFTLGGTRVRDRGFKVDDSHGYAIYLSAPQSQFAESMKHFDVAASTFQPAS